MSERVVVVGAAGFIGKALVNELRKTRIETIGFSRKDCDLLRREEVIQKISPHLGGSTLIYSAGKHRQHGDTLDFYADNSTSVINVLCAAEKIAPKRIIFLSSLEVYGVIEKNQKITESSKLAPASLYAAGKISQEYLVRTWARLNKVPCVLMRLPGIYGPDDNRTSIVSALFDAGINGREFNLHTTGNELRDYIISADLASCVVKIISRTNASEILNIGSGTSVSINYLIDLVGHALGNGIKVHRRASPLSGFDVEIDNHLLKSTLGDFAFTSIEDGVALYANAFAKPGDLAK